MHRKQPTWNLILFGQILIQLKNSQGHLDGCLLPAFWDVPEKHAKPYPTSHQSQMSLPWQSTVYARVCMEGKATSLISSKAKYSPTESMPFIFQLWVTLTIAFQLWEMETCSKYILLF